MTSLTLSTF